jgi:hypothetical protein
VKAIALLVFCLVSVAVADDFKTIDGKEYKNATVRRVEPDGIVVTTTSGISKLYFPQLPKDVQERFRYDPKRSAAYGAQQAQGDNAASPVGTAEVLADRLQQLQGQEDQLLATIGEAEQGRESAHYTRLFGERPYPTDPYYKDPLASQLPLLRSHLADVRNEKDQVRQELEQAQKMAAQAPQQKQRRIICPLCHGEKAIAYDPIGTADSLKNRQSDFPIIGNPLHRKTQTCPVCFGAGYKMLSVPSGMKICPDCKGMGLVYVRSQYGTFTAGSCARCSATGLVADVR